MNLRLILAATLALSQPAWAVDETPPIARLGTHPMVHPDRVQSIEFSPDGASIITVADDAWVWDAVTGNPLRHLQINDTSAMCGALSPDGKTIALAENGKLIHLVDIASGKTRASLSGAKQRASSIVWSADGKHLASTDGKDAILWDAANAKELRRWKTEKSLQVLRFSPDGRSLISASDDAPTLNVHTIECEKQTMLLPGGAGFTAAMRFSPDGTILGATCEEVIPNGHSNSLRFWDPRTGRIIRDIPGSFNALAFSPDGKKFAATGLGFVRVYDTATGAVLHRLPDCNEHIWDVTFSPDGKTLATGQGQRVRRWNTDSWEEIQPGTGHSGPVQTVAFAPDGRTIATGGLDNTIRIWSWPEARELRRIDGVGSSWGVKHLTFSPDGKTLCAAAWVNSGDIFHLYDPATGTLIRRFGKDHLGRSHATFLPGGKEILTGRSNGSIALWDAASGRFLREVGKWKDDIIALQPTADGRSAYWAGGYQGLGLRDLTTGDEIRLFTGGSHHTEARLQVSPDGDWFAVGNRAWDTSTAKLLSDPNIQHRERICAITPDGRYLYNGESLWDSLTKRTFKTGFTQAIVNDAAFAPDGTVLAVARHDGTLVFDMTGLLKEGDGQLPALTLTPAEMETLWQTLGSEDDWVAHLAAWKLAAAGKNAVDFLSTKVRPAEIPDPLKIQTLRARFTDKDYNARDLAARTLLDLGLEVTPAEWHALRRPNPDRGSHAIFRIDPANGELQQQAIDEAEEANRLPPPILLPLPDRLRTSRAILALRRTPIPEATALLETLSDGAPQSSQTKEAKAALKSRTPVSN